MSNLRFFILLVVILDNAAKREVMDWPALVGRGLGAALVAGFLMWVTS